MIGYKRINKITNTAEQFGITTISQLRVFLVHALARGTSIENALGNIGTETEEYKAHKYVLPKLFEIGYRAKKDDGLGLLKSNGNRFSRAQQIDLTDKGISFKKALKLSKPEMKWLKTTLELSRQKGFTTLLQLQVFFVHASKNPMSIKIASNQPLANTKAYKKHEGIIRKFSGTGYRGYDGINLMELVSAPGVGKHYVAVLTEKGCALARDMSIEPTRAMQAYCHRD